MNSGWLKAHRMLKKAISLVILVAFVSNYILSDAWAAVDLGEMPFEGRPGDAGLARLDVETFTIPAHLGEIKLTRKGRSDKFIVHIQDAHCNHFAQKKISDIIDYLNKEYGMSVVNLEGGAGDYNLDVFTAITGEEIRREVAEYFVKKGEINGAELYAINNPDRVTLWGIEDKDLYLDNLKVYRDSLGYKAEVEKYLEELTHVMNNLKRHIFTPELLKIDMAYSAYKAGNSDFRDYLEFLVREAKERAIDVKAFKNLYLLSSAMEMEEGIDFKKANTERSVLVDRLKEGLSKNEVRDLVAKTVDFKTRRLSPKVFYSYLLKKARELGLDIGDYPALSNYIVYVSTYEAVDRSRVMEELDALEAAIKEPLYKNDIQRALNGLSRNLAILKNIFAISLTKTDYRYYLRNRASFDVINFTAFIEKQAPRYRISARPDPNITRLDDFREEISKFYEYSFKRDDVFLKNIRFGKAVEGVKGTVLMTGGFHTENLCDLFEKQGISYVSVLPKFSIEKGYESPYFDILAGETTNIQQMLRSVIAQAAMLQVASFLSPAIAEAVWGETGTWAFKAAVKVQEMVARRNKVVITDAEGKTIDVDGIPCEFGKGAERKMTVAQLLSEVGYTGEIRPEAAPKAELPVTGPPEAGPAIQAIDSYIAAYGTLVIGGLLGAMTIALSIFTAGAPIWLGGLSALVMSSYFTLMAQADRAADVADKEGIAARPSDIFRDITKRFGLALAPQVWVHEMVHRMTRLVRLGRIRVVDEGLAYAAEYVLSTPLAVIFMLVEKGVWGLLLKPIRDRYLGGSRKASDVALYALKANLGDETTKALLSVEGITPEALAGVVDSRDLERSQKFLGLLKAINPDLLVWAARSDPERFTRLLEETGRTPVFLAHMNGMLAIDSIRLFEYNFIEHLNLAPLLNVNNIFIPLRNVLSRRGLRDVMFYLYYWAMLRLTGYFVDLREARRSAREFRGMSPEVLVDNLEQVRRLQAGWLEMLQAGKAAREEEERRQRERRQREREEGLYIDIIEPYVPGYFMVGNVYSRYLDLDQLRKSNEQMSKLDLSRVREVLHIFRRHLPAQFAQAFRDPLKVIPFLPLISDPAEFEEKIKIFSLLSPEVRDAFLPGVVMELVVSLRGDQLVELRERMEMLFGGDFRMPYLDSKTAENIVSLPRAEVERMAPTLQGLAPQMRDEFFMLKLSLLERTRDPALRGELVDLESDAALRWQANNQADFGHMSQLVGWFDDVVAPGDFDKYAGLFIGITRRRDISMVNALYDLETNTSAAQVSFQEANEFSGFVKFLGGRSRYADKAKVAATMSVWSSIRRFAPPELTRDAAKGMENVFSRFLGNEIGIKASVSSMERITDGVKKSLLEHITGMEIPDSLLKDRDLAPRLLVIASLYYNIAGGTVGLDKDVRKGLQERIREALKSLVETGGSADAVRKWMLSDISENREEVEKLISAGYDRSLWEEGVTVKGFVSSGMDEAGKEQQLVRQTQQLVEMTKQLGLIEPEEMEGVVLSSYSEASEFVARNIVGRQEEALRNVSKEVFEEHVANAEMILADFRRLETAQAVEAREEEITIVISKNFLSESNAGVGVPGCFNPFTGIHREMPIMHGLEANAFFAIAYDSSGKQIANTVLAMTDRGVVVFGDYNAGSYDLTPLWTEAWKEMAKRAPSVILAARSAGTAVSMRFGEEADITAVRRSSEWDDPYFDFGKVADDGSVEFGLEKAVVLTRDSVEAAGGYTETEALKRKWDDMRRQKEQVASKADRAAKARLDRIAKAMAADAEMKRYLPILGKIKSSGIRVEEITRDDIREWLGEVEDRVVDSVARIVMGTPAAEAGPAVRARDSMIAAFVSAIPLTVSIVFLFSSLSILPALAGIFTGIQSILLLFQTYYAIDAQMASGRRRAATPEDSYNRIRRNFGPVLAPFVDFHEGIHRFSAKRLGLNKWRETGKYVKLANFLDEVIAYTAAYVAAPFVAAIALSRGLLGERLSVEEEFLRFDPLKTGERENQKMMRDPRWRQFFPERDVYYNEQDPRILTVGSTEMVCPNTIGPGREAGADKYRVEELLGKGGYAAVFRSTVLEGEMKGQERAIKILTPDAESRDVVKFFQEYLTMKRLGHIDGAVDAYDAGTYKVGGKRYYYIAMELAKGGSLGDEIEKRAVEINAGTRSEFFTTEEILDIAEQLLGTIGAVHEVDFFHRDLKPENLYLVEVPKSGEDILNRINERMSELDSAGRSDKKTALAKAVEGALGENWRESLPGMPGEDAIKKIQDRITVLDREIASAEAADDTESALEKLIDRSALKAEAEGFYDKKLKIGDFGMAQYAPEGEIRDNSFIVGTPFYMALESIRDSRYTAKTDLYGIGSILYQLMYNNELPYGADESEREKIDEFLQRGEMKKWARERDRGLTKVTLRMRGMQTGSPVQAPVSQLEALVASLLLEDREGLKHADVALNRISTPEVKREIIKRRRRARESQAAAPAAPAPERVIRIPVGGTDTVDLSAADFVGAEPGAGTAALAPVGPPVGRGVGVAEADLAAEEEFMDIEIVMPDQVAEEGRRVMGEIGDMIRDIGTGMSTSTTMLLPVESLFANIFTGRYGPLNWILRLLAVFSTPIHEAGHILAAKFSGVQVDWTWRGLLTGEVRTDRAPPAVRYGGIIGNLLASMVSGALLLYSLQSPSILTVALLSYIAAVNLAAMFAELIGAAFGRGDIIAARPTTVFRTATRQVAGYARASLVLAVAIGVLATGLSFLVGRQIAAPTVVGAEVSTQEELDRLTAPMLREEFDALKEQAPTMAWFFERQDYEKVVALQGDKEIKENLRKAIERMRDLDPARAAELLGVTKRFLVMDLPEGAQAMAPAGTDIILIDAGHLRRITETGELVEGLILTVAHEADHIENKEKGLHAGMLGLREQAMEEERAYKETLRWLKLLGDTPEQVGMQEFVTNHIKDNGYTGIVARMVTVQPGVAVDRVVAIGNAVNVGVLSDKDEFLTADSATMDIKPTMTEDGRLMVMRLDAVSVVFMRNGILYKAYVTADGEQVIGTEIAPIMAEESIGRIKDADYALSVRRAYLESLIRQAQRDAEVKSLLEGLSRDLQTRMAGETDEGLKGELQRLIGIMSAAGVVVTPQIGKRVLVKRVFERRGKKYLEAESRDKKGKAISHEIPLEERDKEDLKKEVDASIKLADERFSPILRAFRNALDETDAPSLYVFSPLIGDLFGYASPADGLIAVHEHITDNPVAFIHEIGEYLINSGRLSLRYENGAMLVMVDGEQVGDSMLLGSDAVRQAEKNTESPHYLLRSLQREIFGESDVKLTDKIQIEQMAQTLDERLPKDAAAELGINSFDAAKSVRGFIKRGMTAGDMKTPIVVSYRDRTKDGKEVSFLLREGAPKVQPIKLDMEDIQDLHHNRYVGAEMNVLVGEAAPGKSSEEIEKFVELSKMAQSFISGLTRNKLVKELRRISGDDTIEFEDIGKDVYITDHLEGSSKHVFKIEFLAPEGEKTHTIAVATKTEKAKGDISAVEIRELQELQKRPEQVVPRFGADRRWNDKRWFTEEFIEGRTATGLDREGKLTVELKKKVVTALLSIATALGGLTPLDIHGGNFIVRDNGEVVMVDIGDRRFRLFGEAAANIEDEEPRMRHKLVFLATLMAQYGVYEAKKDRKGEPSFAGRPEDNYFIFDAILESKDLPEGEGMKLLREAYEYFRENHARDPDKFAEIFTDHKYMGGFRNVFYPMGISFSANVADMKAGLFPFSNLFMESLGSYLGEAERAPPAAPVEIPQLYQELSDLIDNADEMGWKGTETLLEHIKATPGLANPAAWEGVEQEIEIDENGNVVLYRYAEAEEAFTKSGEAVPVDKLRLTTDGFGEGEEGLLGVPTSFAPELLKGLGRYKGVYRIPVDDFIRLYGDKNLTLGNIGEREVVLSPDIAAKYLDTIQDLTAPAVETEPYKADRLVKGIVMEYGGEAVHMRGMRPDTRIIRSYLDALRARTATGDKVIPEVKKVYLPLTTLRKRTKIETKNEAELPAETIDLLRAANKEGLIELVELRTLNDYDEAADELEADREEFRNLLYDIQIPFMSEYAGRNAQTRLMDLTDSKDVASQRAIGEAVARTLRTLHASKLHAGDTHLGQFTVATDMETAYRVDLGDIKSFDDMVPDVVMRAVQEEYDWIEKNIEGISIAAAAVFRSEYPREIMMTISGASVYAARGAIGDLRGDVVDWVVTPMAELADSAKSSIDSGARRKFSREYGTDTFTEGYTYKAGMSDEKLTENLKKTFAETLEKMSQPKYESKKPRAIVFVPADKYDLAKKALSDVLKEMGLEGLAARISVIKEANIADNGMVDEVMHVVSGKALLNYERFRKGDYPGEFGDAAKLRLANFLKTLVEDPAAIDLASDPDIINKILDGIAVLTMKRIDYEEIREWKSAQDEVLRSL